MEPKGVSIYIYICLQAKKYVHWMKIQYQSWMLHNIYCVPDEKDSRKRTLFLVYFADCTHDAHCQNCPVGVTGECIYSLHCHCPGKK